MKMKKEWIVIYSFVGVKTKIMCAYLAIVDASDDHKSIIQLHLLFYIFIYMLINSIDFFISTGTHLTSQKIEYFY